MVEVRYMKDAVQILAISDDIDVCNLIHTSLSSQGHQAICVPAARDAIQMLSRGVQANLVLLDVPNGQSNEQVFDPTLLQMVRSDQLCVLVEREDTRWQGSAMNWNIRTVLTK